MTTRGAGHDSDDILVRAHAPQTRGAAELACELRPLRVILEFDTAPNLDVFETTTQQRLAIGVTAAQLFSPVECGEPVDPALAGFVAVTVPDGGGQGNSFAVAITAGVAALWFAHHGTAKVHSAVPPSGTVQRPFTLLLRSTSWRPPGFDTSNFGGGVVDAKALLQASLSGSAAAVGASEAPHAHYRSIGSWRRPAAASSRAPSTSTTAASPPSSRIWRWQSIALTAAALNQRKPAVSLCRRARRCARRSRPADRRCWSHWSRDSVAVGGMSDHCRVPY